MDTRLVQMAAVLASPKLRARFANITLGLESQPDVRADRLLIEAGAVRVGQDGRVVISEVGLASLLQAAQDIARQQTDASLIDKVPRNKSQRDSLLRALAQEMFSGEARLSEPEIGARLAKRVEDVALFRRALVDEGFVLREPTGAAYWLPSAPEGADA